MDKDYLKSVHRYLEEKHSSYCLTNKKSAKSTIEDSVRTFSHGINDELYLELNEGRATGLFEHVFFESDLSRSLRILEELIKR